MTDTFRKQKITFSEADAKLVDAIKTKAEELEALLPEFASDNVASALMSRCKLEECVMWAVKNITTKYY